MQKDLETQANGHDVRFNTKEEKWFCDALRVSHMTFPGLKKLIADKTRDQRRINLPVIVRGSALRGPDFLFGTAKTLDAHSSRNYCSVEVEEDGETRLIRQQPIGQIMLDTEENRAKIDKMRELREGARILEKDRSEIENSLETLSRDALEKLISKEVA